MVLRILFPNRLQRIETRAALEEFLDSRAAFVAQKAIFEYSRAAAGYLWQPLFDEEMFRAALERARWLAYPLGLAATAEIAEGQLRPAARSRETALLNGLSGALVGILERQTPPDSITADEWTEASGFCMTRTQALQLRPVRAVKDVTQDIAEKMFPLLPVHEKIRGRDPVLLRNNITATLLAVHEEFARHGDTAKLAASLFDDSAPLR